MLNTFGRFPEEQPELLAKLYDRQVESLPFYEMLVELVRAGDAENARQTLRGAFLAVDQDWLARHGMAPTGGSAPRRDARSAAKPPLLTPKPAARKGADAPRRT